MENINLFNPPTSRLDGFHLFVKNLPKKYAESDNYVEIARLKEMKRVQKIMEYTFTRYRQESLCRPRRWCC